VEAKGGAGDVQVTVAQAEATKHRAGIARNAWGTG